MTLLVLIFALDCLGSANNLHVYRLTMTGEGCAYVQLIGLPVERNNGICTTEAAFEPFAISGGGMLHINADKEVQVTDTLLLAAAKSDTLSPFTTAQRVSLKWFLVWVCAAIVIGATTFIYSRTK